MLTATDKKNLKKALAMGGEPDDTFSYDELLGYLFGLAITPDMVVPSEWMPIIFGGDLPPFRSMDQMQKMTGVLVAAYNNFLDDYHSNKLKFPFDIATLQENQFEPLYEWVSGFEEAIALREDMWDPEEYPELSESKKEELYHSMMTIQGLVDPVEVMDYFEDMPEELFQEAFSGMDEEFVDREMQIQFFLLASLPLVIDTFLEHAHRVEKKRQRQLQPTTGPIPIRSAKVGRNDPCPCNSGKKYKKCCGAPSGQKVASPDKRSSKGAKVIKVDFPQHGKKKALPAPVYQLKVSLQDAKPPIWRRIRIPGEFTLDQVHSVIQICMDWEDLHLHQFLIDRTCYSIPEEDEFWRSSRPKNEARYTLQDLEKKIEKGFQYIYDFGDEWIHQIAVEKIIPPEESKPFPVLLAGRRACPPEDIGGIHKYRHILEVLSKPDHEEYQKITSLLNMDFFDPAQFDKEDILEINATLEDLFPRSKR